MMTFQNRQRRIASFLCSSAVLRDVRHSPAMFSISIRACWSVLQRCPRQNGGGSLTALPIIETQAGDVSAYIPTNVISITDGQIYLEPDLFYAGIRPAVNVGLSVSRVGGAAQTKAMKQIAGTLRLDLAQFRELAAFAAFGADLDKATMAQIERGKRMVELLKQGQYVPLPVEDQIIGIFAGSQGYMDDVPVDAIRRFEAELIAFMKDRKSDVRSEIAAKKALADDLKAKLKDAIVEFKKGFVV